MRSTHNKGFDNQVFMDKSILESKSIEKINFDKAKSA